MAPRTFRFHGRLPIAVSHCQRRHRLLEGQSTGLYRLEEKSLVLSSPTSSLSIAFRPCALANHATTANNKQSTLCCFAYAFKHSFEFAVSFAVAISILSASAMV